MNTVHIIWHHVRNDRISDMKEPVGVVLTGWQDADEIVERLNSEDPDRPSWSKGCNYWKEEIDVFGLQVIGG